MDINVNEELNYNNLDNDLLFFKIFRNNYLKKEIFKHVRLFNLNGSRSFFSSLSGSKYKDYIQHIHNYSFREKNRYILNNFKELTNLEFNENFDKIILPNSLPNTIKSIKFNKNFKKPIQVDVLPKSLEYLSFYTFYNVIPMTINIFPNSLTTLKFDKGEKVITSYNSSFGGFNFNLTQGILPNSLTKLNFANNFNTKFNLKSLPNSIKFLKLPGYNEPLDDNVLPDNLIELEMGSFNRDFNENTFTNCKQINKLILNKFNQKISGTNSLPNSLTHLELLSFNQPISDTKNNCLLPNNLKYLDINMFKDYNLKNKVHFPNSIETLIIGNIDWISSFPNSLKSLSYFYEEDKQLQQIQQLQKQLVNALFSLIKFTNLNLNHCCIIKSPKPNIDGKNCFVHLYYYHQSSTSDTTKKNDIFNTIVAATTTINIKLVELKRHYYYFEWSFIRIFNNLKEIIFDKHSTFNRELHKGVLPYSLERLEFGDYWNNGSFLNNKDLAVGIFPNQIKILKFGKYFITRLSLIALPTSLIELTLPKKSLLLIPENKSLNFKLTLLNLKY
ncbi:hypothetical protein ACTFIZ_001986 [Dictyostelium cf. discoideum]